MAVLRRSWAGPPQPLVKNSSRRRRKGARGARRLRLESSPCACRSGRSSRLRSRVSRPRYPSPTLRSTRRRRRNPPRSRLELCPRRRRARRRRRRRFRPQTPLRRPPWRRRRPWRCHQSARRAGARQRSSRGSGADPAPRRSRWGGLRLWKFLSACQLLEERRPRGRTARRRAFQPSEEEAPWALEASQQAPAA